MGEGGGHEEGVRIEGSQEWGEAQDRTQEIG